MNTASGDSEPLAWRRRKDHRPQEILIAARRLIEEEGTVATSMARIAKLAGISEATVYKYFASKQDLVNQVLAEWAALFVERLAAELPHLTGIRSQLTLIAIRFLRSMEETPKLHRVFYQELRWGDYRGSELHRLNRQFAHSVVDVIERAAATGDLREGVNPIMMRDMLFGGLEHIAMRTSFIGRAIDIEVEAAHYVELMLSGILKPAGDTIATNIPSDPITGSLDRLAGLIDRMEHSLGGKA